MLALVPGLALVLVPQLRQHHVSRLLDDAHITLQSLLLLMLTTHHYHYHHSHYHHCDPN